MAGQEQAAHLLRKKVNLKNIFSGIAKMRTAAGTCPLWGPGKRLFCESRMVLINYTEQRVYKSFYEL